MSEYKRCDRCKGNKRIMRMGFTIVDCPVCRGVGYLDKPKQDNIMQSNTIEHNIVHTNRKTNSISLDQLKNQVLVGSE